MLEQEQAQKEVAESERYVPLPEIAEKAEKIVKERRRFRELVAKGIPEGIGKGVGQAIVQWFLDTVKDLLTKP